MLKKRKLTVTTARPLTEAEQKRVVDVFSAKYDEPIEPDYIIDDSLIGGIMIFDGKTVYDGSIKSKIERIKEKLDNEN
ncbi:MAG: F0F1 ATP synthase subunit delta [Clostridia bacterium]|nr:F0F1 ATP synthase subunit delta [Clostridia bacterium]